jgi:transcriptional regulator NrdR family protein
MSMLCACGAKAKVIDSRYSRPDPEVEVHHVRRRYACTKNCRPRWTTIEFEIATVHGTQLTAMSVARMGMGFKLRKEVADELRKLAAKLGREI